MIFTTEIWALIICIVQAMRDGKITKDEAKEILELLIDIFLPEKI